MKEGIWYGREEIRVDYPELDKLIKHFPEEFFVSYNPKHHMFSFMGGIRCESLINEDDIRNDPTVMAKMVKKTVIRGLRESIDELESKK